MGSLKMKVKWQPQLMKNESECVEGKVIRLEHVGKKLPERKQTKIKEMNQG